MYITAQNPSLVMLQSMVMLFLYVVLVLLSDQAGSVDLAPMENVRFSIPDVVLFNTNLTMKASVSHGTNVYSQWIVNATKVWEICYLTGLESEYNFYPLPDNYGVIPVTVIVSSNISSSNLTKAIEIVNPVRGFAVEIIDGEKIGITAPSADHFPMGNLTVEVHGLRGIVKEKTPISPQAGESMELTLTNLPKVKGLYIRIASPISEQIERIDLDDSPGPNIVTSHPFGLVGEPVDILFNNSVGTGYQYTLDYGDEYIEFEDLQSENIVSDIKKKHIYNEIGTYTLSLNVSNFIFQKTSTVKVTIVDLQISTEPLITLPSGSTHVSVVIKTNFPPNKMSACDLNFGDTTTSPVYDGDAIDHAYRQSGQYNITLTCPFDLNRIPNALVNVKTFLPSDFNITYPDNISKNLSGVIVQFRLSLFGVARVPPDVHLLWDFNDTSELDSHLMSTWVKRHEFQTRGQFNVSLTIRTAPEVKQTFLLPIQIGIVQFICNRSKGIERIDLFVFQVYELPSDKVNLTLSYGDGIEEEFIEEVILDGVFRTEHVYRKRGAYRPKLTVRTVDFYEVVPLNQLLTIRSNGSPMEMAITPLIVSPPGVGELLFKFLWDTNTTDVITCLVDYNDGGIIDILKFTFIATPIASFQHTFGMFGDLIIRANCSSSDLGKMSLQVPTVVVSSCYSHRHTLFNLDSPVIKSVSKELSVAAHPDIVCRNMTPVFLWHVDRLDNINQTRDLQRPSWSNTTVLVLPARSMEVGSYLITFYTNFKEQPALFKTGTILVIYESSPIFAGIKGGTLKMVGRSQEITVDALSVSHDPDTSADDKSTLAFSWRLTSHKSLTEARTAKMNGTYDFCSVCEQVSHWRVGVIVFPPECLPVNRWNVFHVTVSKGSRTGYAYQIIFVSPGNRPQIDLRCKVNCKEKVNAEFSFSLESECLNCNRTGRYQLSYEWILYRMDHDTMGLLGDKRISLEDLTETGTSISTLAVRPYTFIPGTRYRLLFESAFPGHLPTTIHRDIVVNYPPYNGTCYVTPEQGYAVYDRFQVICDNWIDEADRQMRSDKDDGKHLQYRFILNANGKSSLLYAGGSRMTTRQHFNVGAKSENFTVRVTVRIFDWYNGMAEINMTARVLPPSERSSENNESETLDTMLDTFDGMVDDAVTSGDIFDILRLSESVSSTLNSMALNQMSQLPTDWMNTEKTNTTGNDSVETWDYLWDGYLTPEQIGEEQKVTEANARYLEAVSDSVKSADISSLDTVYMASTSMDALLDNPYYGSTPGKGATVDTLEVLGTTLDDVVTADMSDTQVDEVLGSLYGVVDKTVHGVTPLNPMTESDLHMDQSLKEIDLNRKYLQERIPTDIQKRLQAADLNDEERAFFLTREKLRQTYFDNQRKEMAKVDFQRLQGAIDNVLNSASTFMVEGQDAKMFRTPNMISSIEKKSVETILNQDIQRGDVNIKVKPSKTFDADDMADLATLKTTIYDQNPFSWENEDVVSRISSPAVFVDMSTSDTPEFTRNGSSLSYSILLPNRNTGMRRPTSVTPNLIPLDMDQMTYHRLEFKSTKDTLLVSLKPSRVPVIYDVYFKSGEFPTSLSHHYHTTVQFEQNVTKIIRCPPGHLPSPGKVFLGLKPSVMVLQVVYIPQSESQLFTENTKQQMYNRKEHEHLAIDFLKDKDEFGIGDDKHPRLKREISSSTGKHHSDSSQSKDTGNVKNAKYDIAMAATSCTQWRDPGVEWDEDVCKVDNLTTLEKTKCTCNLPLSSIFTIASTLYFPVNMVDFSTVFTEIDLKNNASVFSVVIVMLLLYILLLIWARRKDTTDIIKWGVTALADNSPDHGYLYMITVYTGMRMAAGTKSKVGFVIAGETSDTGTRLLNDGIRNGFPKQSVMHYLMAVDSCLGELQYLQIWHDNSGKGSLASWFLHKVVVEDIQEDKKFIFKCDKWLGVDEADGLIERVLPVTSKENLLNFSSLFYNNARKNVTDSHIWFSVLFRPQRSHFTRVQRLSCCACLLFLSMICNAVFYQGRDNIVYPTTINLGFLRLSVHQVYTSLMCIFIVTPVELALIWLFKKSKPVWNGSVEIVKGGRGCGTCFISKERLAVARALLSKGFLKPKGTLLPHFCIYIAWGMVILCIATSSFFVFLLSQQWGRAKSEEWLTAFLLTFFESLIILDPLKVICLAIFFAMFVHKLEEDSNDLNKEDIRMNCRSAIKKKQSEPLQSPVTPLGADEVERVRTVRLRETKTVEVIKEIGLYLLFLLIMCSIGYTNRDPRSFTLKNSVDNMLVATQQDGRLGLQDVKTVEQYFDWLNQTAFPVLFHQTYYNGSRRSWRDRFFIRDLQNIRIGPPRLRQVRVAQAPLCLVSGIPEDKCNINSPSDAEDMFDYCIGWKTGPCSEAERAFHLTSDAWRYTSSGDIWGMPVIGVYNTYSGGGYIATLNVNLDVSTAVLQELFSKVWVSKKTRLLTLDFTVYNANTNLFCFVSLIAEFPGTGGTITTATVSPFRVYQYAGSLGNFVFFTEITFVLLLVVAVVKLVLKLIKHGTKHLFDLWHIFDFVSLIACFVAIGMYGLRKFSTEMAMHRHKLNSREFINFQQVTFWDNMMVAMVGLVTFTCTVRTVKILGFSRRLNAIIAVLAVAGKDLFYFSMMFMIFLMAFVACGYFMFGQNLKAYKTVLNTCETLMTSLVGKSPFNELRHKEPVMAQIYFSTFVFFFVFVLLTMFQVILNQSIALVRLDKGFTAFQHEMIDVLQSKIKSLLAFFTKSKDENEQNSNTDESRDMMKFSNVIKQAEPMTYNLPRPSGRLSARADDLQSASTKWTSVCQK